MSLRGTKFVDNGQNSSQQTQKLGGTKFVRTETKRGTTLEVAMSKSAALRNQRALEKYEADTKKFKSTHVEVKDGWVSASDFEALSTEDRALLKEKGVQEFNRIKDAEYQAFVDTHEQIGEEWITKEDFNSLSPEKQARLREIGVAAFNLENQTEYDAFVAEHIQIGEEWITKIDWEGLSDADKARIQEIGIEAFNEEKEAEYNAFIATHVETKDGWITKEDYDALSTEDKQRIVSLGVEAFNAENEAAYNAFVATHVEVKDGWVTKEEYNALSPEDQKRIKEIGAEAFNTEKQAIWNEFSTTHVEVKDGWITKADYDALSASDQQRIKQIGASAFNEEKKAQATAELNAWKSQHVQVADGWITLEQYNKLTPAQQTRIKQIGVVAFNQEQQATYLEQVNEYNTEWSEYNQDYSAYQTADGKWHGAYLKIISWGGEIHSLTEDEMHRLGIPDGSTATFVADGHGGVDMWATYPDGSTHYFNNEQMVAVHKESLLGALGPEPTEPAAPTINYPTEPTPQTGKQLAEIRIIGVGGTLEAPSQAYLDALGVPEGSTVTVTLGQVVVTKPDGDIEVYNAPTEQDSAQLQTAVEQYNLDIKNYEYELLQYNANPTEAGYKRLVSEGQDLENRGIAISRLVAQYNVASAGIPTTPDVMYGAAPELKRPKGLAQSLWWGITPWQEEGGQTVKSYYKTKGVLGATHGIVGAGLQVAAPAVGLAALTFIAPPLGVAASAALGGYMAYQTQQNWSRMSTAERYYSVAMSALCFAPFVGAATRSLKNASIGPYRVAGKLLGKAELASSKSLTKVLNKTYGKSVGKAYTNMTKTQVQLLDTYMKIETLVQQKGLFAKIKGFFATDIQMEARLVSEINKLRTKAAVLEQNLEFKARVYNKALTQKAGFDSPRFKSDPEFLTARQISDTLAREIVRNTRQAAYAVTGKSGTSIKNLKLQADQAASALKAAQQKWPSNISKWADLAYEAAVKQQRYELARLGSPQKLLAQLNEVRDILKSGKLANGKPIPEALVEGSRINTKLRLLEKQLYESYASTAKSSDLEIAVKAKRTVTGEYIRDADGNIVYEIPEGVGGRGGVATATKIGVKPPKTGGGVGVKPSTATMTTAQLLALTGAIGATAVSHLTVGRKVPVTGPDISTRPSIATPDVTTGVPSIEIATVTKTEINSIFGSKIDKRDRVEIQNLVNSALINSIKGLPKGSIKNVLQDELKNRLEALTSPQTRAQAQTKLTQLTKLALDKLQDYQFKRTRVPPLRGGITIGGKLFTRKELKGAKAFQQGFLTIAGKKKPVIYVYLRGRDTPVVNVGPVKGIKVQTGKGAPQRTLKSFGRGLTSAITTDIGAFRVTVPEGTKGKLRYKVDITNKRRRVRPIPKRSATPTIARMR